MHTVFERLAAGNIEVGQSIVVVVEPHTAGASAFEKRSEFLGTEAMRELDSGLRGRIVESDRTGRRGWRGLRQKR